MRLISEALDFDPSLYPYISCYVDDLAVYPGGNAYKHMQMIEKMLICFRRANFKLAASKCSFFRKSLNFIGHTFSADGVRPIQDKLSALMDMPVPHDKRSLKGTLGALSYYRVYILNFSKYAAVLQDLLKRDAPWVWEERHQAAFLKFRELLKNVPTLSFTEESAETGGPFT